jgi:uncharacterized protein YndB with AHSA1/START domain
MEMWWALPGPPAVVWELITDWEHQDDWMLEARNFEITSAHREGIGVEGKATVKIAGITTTDTVVVTGWQPEKRLAIAHEGWVSGEAEMLLTELPDGSTHMLWREELVCRSLGAVGSIGLSIFRPLMRWIFMRDLRILESLTRAAARRL